MPSTRLRLTVSYSFVGLGSLLAFAAALWVSRRATAISDVGREAGALGDKIAADVRDAYQKGAQLTVVDSGYSPPLIVATYNLTQVMDGFPGYVFLVDRDGHVLYKSQAIRTLPPINRHGVPDADARDTTTDQADTLRHYAARLATEPEPVLVSVVRDASHTTRIALTERGDRGLMGNPYISRVIVGLPVDIGLLPGQLLMGSFLLILPVVFLLSLPAAHLALRGDFSPPVDEMINEVEAISDGRSLHRRLLVDRGSESLSRLSGTLNAMLERLELSFGGLRRFTADASHELKTPLTVMRADVERAMHPNTRSTERMVALEEALQEVARMTDLVESLLTLARADEGRFDLTRDPVPLRPLLHEVFETAIILGEAARLNIVMSGVSDAVVMGDQTRLRQLFLNLLTNAIKYTPRGGRVELAMQRRSDTEVTVSVRDTGIGIAAADLPQVFQRFWRADRARSRASERPGSGLGLAIAHWIATAHGGTLTVQSRLGRGSLFTVCLPSAAVPAGPDAVGSPDATTRLPDGAIGADASRDFTNS